MFSSPQETTAYTIYAPSSSAALTEFKEKFYSLYCLYQPSRVKLDYQQGRLSCTITLFKGDTISQFLTHSGLRSYSPSPTSTEDSGSPASKVPVCDGQKSYGHDDSSLYIAFAANATNTEEMERTREFINWKVTNPERYIIELYESGTENVAAWANLQLSEASKEEVEAYAGIKAPLLADSEEVDETKGLAEDAQYIVFARDPFDDEETKATREFLNGMVTDKKRYISMMHKSGTQHISGWGHIQLSIVAKKQVEAYEGVKSVYPDYEVTDD